MHTPKRAKAEQPDRALTGRGRRVRVRKPVATGLRIPQWTRSAGALEEKAVCDLVHGLVQSVEYARRVIPRRPRPRTNVRHSCGSHAMRR